MASGLQLYRSHARENERLQEANKRISDKIITVEGTGKGTAREIDDYSSIKAGDTTVIDPSRTDEFLTASTCYPFSCIGCTPD